MPIFAQYNFSDATTEALDSAPINGPQNGIYLNAAVSSGGQAVLDGIDDFIKIRPSETFQMDRGTLEINFSQTPGTVLTGPKTILSRDSTGVTEGGFRMESLPDGSILISHESPTGTVNYSTGPGFQNPGDQINIRYSWDATGSGGFVAISNETTGGAFNDTVPNTLTMDQGGISQDWMIGAGQSNSPPDTLANIDQHYPGSFEQFTISDTVDNVPVAGGPDGIVDGTSGDDLIDTAYLGDPNGDRVDALDALLPGQVGNDDIIRAGSGNDTVFAGLGNDEIDGSAGDDVIYGGVGDDSIFGGAGDDSIFGGAGDDSTDAGDGNDTIFGGGGREVINGEAGDDLIDTRTGFQSPDIDYPGLYPADTDPLNNRDTIYGGDGNDTIFSGDDADRVFGRDGDDFIDGGVDNDSLYGNSGSDTIIGGEGRDSIDGGRGDDLIFGGLELSFPDSINLPNNGTDLRPFNNNDFIQGGFGNDTIYGQDDDDTILGDEGNDLIFGGIDNDSMFGGDGDDTIFGGQGNDFADAGTGDDSLSGGIGDDTLSGGLGDDTVNGDEGNDVLTGEDGDDVLFGGAGDDNLDGGVNNDTLTGGTGADTLTGGFGRDRLDLGTDGIADGVADIAFGGADEDTIAGVGVGDQVFGGGDGETSDQDVLELGLTPFRVVDRVTDSDGNGFDGRIEFLDTDGNVTGSATFTNIENIVCFTPGTLIATPKGEIAVENLRIGDKVITRDNGLQEIRWMGGKEMGWHDFAANPHLKPVLVKAGSLGNDLPERDMMLSPNHRLLVANDRTALYFDEHEVLVAAKHLIGGKGIQQVNSVGTTYFHFMFDQHEVVLSNGAWTESFQPGDYTLKGLGNAQRTEVFELFPELKTVAGVEAYQAARKTLKKHETSLLVR